MAYLATKLPGAAKNCGVRYEDELCQITTDGVVFPELLPAMIDPWIEIKEGTFPGKRTANQQLEAQNKDAKAAVAAEAKAKADFEAKQNAERKAKNEKAEPKPQSKRKKKKASPPTSRTKKSTKKVAKKTRKKKR